MIDRKKALQKLWNDLCSVYVKTETFNKDTKLTDFTESLLYENQPCKLSIESLADAGEGKTASVSQSVTLFTDNNVDIPAGSRIDVTRDGRTLHYKRSGTPGIFTYHQEIPIELYEKWA